MTKSVVCANLSKIFGSTIAVNKISLEIEDGEFLVILGPSGCGKTTLLRMIAGLEHPTEGDIYINGNLVTDQSPRDRNIAMVFQDYALYPYKNIYGNLAFPLEMRRASRAQIDEKVKRVAQLLGLETLLKRKPGELSGGQRQRVALGRAIIREPSVFLMDEPLSNLDAKLRVDMRAEILALHQRLKTTFIYVTHDQVEAMTMGQRIVVMDRGNISQIGTPLKIYHYPKNRHVAEFIGTPTINIFPVTILPESRTLGLKELRVPAPTHLLEAAHVLGEREFIMGIRPEHLKVVPPHSPPSDPALITIEARYKYRETLGHEDIVYLDVQGYRATVRGEPGPTWETGEPVLIRFRPEHTRFFRESGGEAVAQE